MCTLVSAATGSYCLLVSSQEDAAEGPPSDSAPPAEDAAAGAVSTILLNIIVFPHSLGSKATKKLLLAFERIEISNLEPPSCIFEELASCSLCASDA
jgi:hypothetical protein